VPRHRRHGRKHIYNQFDLPGVRERVIAEMARVYTGVLVFGEDLMELSADPKTPGIFL
jgi:ribonuclease Z